ncbi:MAG: hypothetical protein H6686_12490 [Fibrobacteria bacterium]|nr:hypothetical protein [Fibrobacteria bacterium]
MPVLSLLLALASWAGPRPAETFLPADAPGVAVFGRAGVVEGGIRLAWPGSGIRASFSGDTCEVRLASTGAILSVVLDGRPQKDIVLGVVQDTVLRFEGSRRRRTHLLELGKKTEGSVGHLDFRGIRMEAHPEGLPVPPQRRIEFFGNSITCGYGVLDSVKEHHFDPATQDVFSAWGWLAGQELRADTRTICASGKGLVRNYGGSTSDILPRTFNRVFPDPSAPKAIPSPWQPQVVVVNLGTNDFSFFPPPDSADWERSIEVFIQDLRKGYGPVPVVLADGPMLSDYWPQRPDGTPFPSLTTVRSHLERVAGRIPGVRVLHLTPNDPKRGYGADWHPNRAQQRLNAQEAARFLAPLLDSLESASAK